MHLSPFIVQSSYNMFYQLTFPAEARLQLLATAYVYAEKHTKPPSYAELAKLMGGKYTTAAVNSQMTSIKKMALTENFGKDEGVNVPVSQPRGRKKSVEKSPAKKQKRGSGKRKRSEEEVDGDDATGSGKENVKDGYLDFDGHGDI